MKRKDMIKQFCLIGIAGGSVILALCGALNIVTHATSSVYQEPYVIRNEREDRYVAVERDGCEWDYMTQEEFYLVATFVEVVAKDCSYDGKKSLAQLVINRRFSEEFSNLWNELILDKEENGLYQYIPKGVSLDEVVVSVDTEDALFSAILYPQEDGFVTDMEAWVMLYEE